MQVHLASAKINLASLIQDIKSLKKACPTDTYMCVWRCLIIFIHILFDCIIIFKEYISKIWRSHRLSKFLVVDQSTIPIGLVPYRGPEIKYILIQCIVTMNFEHFGLQFHTEGHCRSLSGARNKPTSPWGKKLKHLSNQPRHPDNEHIRESPSASHIWGLVLEEHWWRCRLAGKQQYYKNLYPLWVESWDLPLHKLDI